MALLQPKVPFWVLPHVPAEAPIFIVFGDFEWAPKKGTIFQKQIVATKMRGFFSFRTQIVFDYFSEKWQFTTKNIFSQPPKKHNFLCFFFEIFIFHGFSFSNKEDKN